ncbi:MAG: Fimbrial assembly family protein [Frankiales bacterium]|nr:Fimbrial assembly family protein [Frankiales bacterium]
MTLTTTVSEEAITRPIGTGFAVLPRVNLLPPEIAERQAARRIQVILGAALVAVVVLIGLVYVAATHGVTAAQDDLTAAQNDHTRLQAQATQYSNVNAIYAAADAAQAQLVTAMGDEVRFSQLLTSLSLSIPSSVWVSSISMSQTPLTTSTVGTPTIGSFTVSGTGFSHNDVGLWLESIAGVKSYSDPYFSSSTEGLLGTRKIVTFTSNANLTPQAMSHRYSQTQTAGG